MDSFVSKARSCLDQIALSVESLPEIDFEESEDSLIITLPQGLIYLFNIHHSMQQIWLSSPFSGGRHFFYHAPQWIDTRNGEALFSVFSQEFLSNTGFSLSFA